jgi:cytochrome d ubiquinol oxidase subunit I
VATSLIAFVIVYFAVFGAGTWYILRLMAKPPHAHESGVEDAPIRSAGIMPGPTQNPTGSERLPEGEEDA